MNAVALPSTSPSSSNQDAIREWIAELTDFTPQQIEAILSQMEQPSEVQDGTVREPSRP